MQDAEVCIVHRKIDGTFVVIEQKRADDLQRRLKGSNRTQPVGRAFELLIQQLDFTISRCGHGIKFVISEAPGKQAAFIFIVDHQR